MRPLLSNKEIIQFSGITTNFPTCELRNIHQVELTETNLCLGHVFITELKTHLTDLTNIPEWSSGTIYNLNDIVFYQGIAYTSLSLDNSDLPTNYTKWKLTEKFSLDCVNDFWCTFLGEYLSLSTIISQLPGIRTHITAEGIILKTGDHFVPADNKTYENTFNYFLGRKHDLFHNMEIYVKRVIKEDTSECVDLFKKLKFIGIDCCSGCGFDYDDCLCNDSNCTDERGLYIVG